MEILVSTEMQQPPADRLKSAVGAVYARAIHRFRASRFREAPL
jgi:hypothetical protein